MARARVIAIVVAVLLSASSLLAVAAPADLGHRLQVVVEGYSDLVHELDLNDLPTTLPGYPQVTDELDRLGEKLDQLSRVAGKLTGMPLAQRRQVDQDLSAFEADFTRLQCDSLPLRLWAHYHELGVQRPAWGLCVDTSRRRLPRARRQFNAPIKNEVAMAARPGQAVATQLVAVPITHDLKGLRVSCTALRGPAGAIPAAAIQFAPVRYYRASAETGQAEAKVTTDQVILAAGPVDVPADELQPLWLAVTVPAKQEPGRYCGYLSVAVRHAGTIRLKLTLDVQPAPDAHQA